MLKYISKILLKGRNVILKSGHGYREKRDFPRMLIDTELTYTIEGQNKSFTGLCKNISHSGILFYTKDPVSEGNILKLTIDSKNDKFEPVKVTAEVVRVEFANEQLYSVACRITEFK
jgi:hypothetical protein